MRQLVALFIYLTVTVAAPGQQPASPDVISQTRVNLQKEWRDLTLYPDPDNPPAPVTGTLLCLRALEGYTRTGSADPKDSAAYGLKLLSAGESDLVRAIYKLVPAEHMLAMLAPEPTEINISKDNAAISDWLFDQTRRQVDALSSSDLAKIAPLLKNNPPRALLALLSTQTQALADYPKLMAAASAAASDLAGAQELQRNAQQLNDALGRATTTAKSALDRLEALQKERSVLREQLDQAGKKSPTPKTDATTPDKPPVDKKALEKRLQDVEKRLKNAEADPALAPYREAERKAREAEEMWQKVSLPAIEGKAKQAADDFQKGSGKAKAAVDAIEIYRVCYALDKDKLFRLVTDRLRQ